jgi:hypothetical protein
MERKLKPQLEKTNVKFDIERRRVVLSALLISILVVLSVFNQTLFAPSKSTPVSGGRGIASVEGFAVDQKAETQWEYKLAKQVSHPEADAERDMASIGQMPSGLEQFRFGLLENKYQFNFKEGKVSALRFPEDSPDRPKYITEAKNFLLDHSTLFSVPFKTAKFDSKKASGENQSETFKLLDKDSKPIGQATVVTDQYGRLLSLEVNSL